jgi:hypothetical protein
VLAVQLHKVATMKATKEKAASPCQGEAAQQTNHNQNSNRPDALLQWHALGANAKSLQIKRQQKREWKRGRK